MIKDPALVSHNLIDKQSYEQTYARLKETYGRSLAKTWTERTDPSKFVYEDCAIASYILNLRCSLNFASFVDVGCGNGLLTFLLNAERVHGCGIDARRRRIWERFALNGGDLRQTSIDASDEMCTSLPPSADFLIGNHNDELTPWLPVMAARRKCAFFLLPCCPHDFFTKFCNRATSQKHGIGVSRYAQYLNYIESIGRRLGFIMRRDRLKIPSAKNIAFIGTIPSEGLAANVEAEIARILQAASKDSANFKPIAAVEPVRNCTQLPYEFRQKLSRKLCNLLLVCGNDSIDGWRCGTTVTLLKLATALSDEEKAQLKTQCGGLQTFLRNHHQAFVVDRGAVALRRWPEVYATFLKDGGNRKTAKCWFKANHPQGCPVDEQMCSYNHNF